MAILKSPIKAGTSLEPGDSVRSSNELFELLVQEDGNLVLHELLLDPRGGRRVVWQASPSAPPRGTRARFEKDGRLVLEGGGAPVWSSEKACPGKRVAELRVRDDGYVVACPRSSHDDKDVYWSSTPLAPAVHRGSLRAGESLFPDDALLSENGVFELRYQAVDGNLALYAWSISGESFLWMPWGAPIGPAGRVGLAKDGQLVVHARGDRKVWSSGKRCPAGKSVALRLRNDGNLVVSDDDGTTYWETGTRFDFDRFALLIGVEDYSAFRPSGEKDLLAGRNDVLAMWQVCRRLGYAPQNIRVRTSPPLAPQQIRDAEMDLALSEKKNRARPRGDVERDVDRLLEGVKWGETLGSATSAQIKASLKWLSDRLGRPFREGRGYLVPGILYYSGHGAQLQGDLALCPSDVTQTARGLQNALSFGELQRTLDKDDTDPSDERSPTKYLTVVLDCCFAGAPGERPSWIPTSLTPEGARSASAPAIRAALGQRIFCASRSDEHAYQALLGGRWHGAFTWAFTQAMEQWTVATSGIHSYVNVSHAELLFRSRTLLEALSFPQHPILMDSIVNTPVFWCGMETVQRGQVFRDRLHAARFRSALAVPSPTAEPDRDRFSVQLDPSGGGKFTLVALNDGVRDVAVIVLVAEPEGEWKAELEHWFVSAAFDTSQGTATWRLSVSVTDDVTGYDPSESVQIPRDTVWSRTTATVDQAWSDGGGFVFGLTATATGTGSGASVAARWFHRDASNLRFEATTYSLTRPEEQPAGGYQSA